LVSTSAAVRDREVLRFDYRRHDGEAARREAEPHRLVHAGRRWYLVGWDLARRDWRTYRMDRMSLRIPNGPRFPPRDPPDGGFDQYFKRALSVNSWPVVGRFLLHSPARELLGRSQLTEGMIEPVDEHSCLLTVGADSVSMLFVLVGIYDVDFTVLDPPGAARRAAELAERYRLAADHPSPGR
jgi:predicted DNA-binding transcriptional regulator YafY